MLKFLAPLLAALGVCAPAAVADPLWQDDLNWLKTMVFASRQTDYSGVFIYRYGNRVETSHFTHVVDGDGEHARLIAMDGARREIIRSNNQVWCYLGDSKVKLEDRRGARRFPAILPEQLSLLNENYHIKQTEEGRVAGFHAHAIVFKPRDAMRFAHRMWAHSDSGLLLKSEVMDERERVIEQNSFIQITIGGNNMDRSWIRAEKTGAASAGRPEQHDAAAHAQEPDNPGGWKVDVPPGFRKVAEMRRTLRDKKEPATHMVYSDGLASISVFIEALEGEGEGYGLSSQGATQIYRKATGDRLLTLVGEVPPRTLIQVAESVRHGGQ
jgi:sigma-E factor negative regulatory protein RseB